MSESAVHSTHFQLLGIPHEYNPVAGAVLVSVVLLLVGLRVRSQLSKPENHTLPSPKVSILNVSEMLVGTFRGLLDTMIGHGADAYLPVIVTTFLFIFASNLLGLIPGFTPPTESINTNLAISLFIFLSYQFLGIREHGFGYLKQFTGGLPPKGFGAGITIVLAGIACLLFVIEVIGHVIRPVSLSLRLWGNINGDHTLIGVFHGIVPFLIPVIFMILGVFVSLVQALVFSLLSTVYIKLAVSHDH